MKLLAFKNYFQNLSIILKTSIKYSFQLETAYPAENWTNLLSTTFYIATYLAFVKIIYGNVDQIVGYSYQEMLLFTFMGQFAFYISWGTFWHNFTEIVEKIRLGDLDLILTKPLPTLTYLVLRKTRTVSLVRDAIVPTVMISILINFSSFNFHYYNVIAGILISAMGIICFACFMTFLTIPAFYFGESKRIVKMSYDLFNGGQQIPLAGFSKTFKIIFSSIIPVIISSGIATSVMLGKSNPTKMLFYVFFVMIILLVLQKLAWKKGLKAYTSASS